MTFDIPADLYYEESHEWFSPDTGRVGVTDFAQDELGDVVFVELPDVGDSFDRGESFGVVESIKAVSDVYAPVGGEVVAVNGRLDAEPELVNEDPYGEGWLVEIEPAEETEVAVESLLTPDEYREQTE